MVDLDHKQEVPRGSADSGLLTEKGAIQISPNCLVHVAAGPQVGFGDLPARNRYHAGRSTDPHQAEGVWPRLQVLRYLVQVTAVQAHAVPKSHPIGLGYGCDPQHGRADGLAP
ncbi:UNVERIFIED_CONTAM: hypothetical protein ACS92_05855 [Bacillus cereus]